MDRVTLPVHQEGLPGSPVRLVDRTAPRLGPGCDPTVPYKVGKGAYLSLLPHSNDEFDPGFETLTNRGRKRNSNPFGSVISDRVVRLDEIKELYSFR
ncbi:unnamed protein product [Musa acuminata var. zebrina]